MSQFECNIKDLVDPVLAPSITEEPEYEPEYYNTPVEQKPVPKVEPVFPKQERRINDNINSVGPPSALPSVRDNENSVINVILHDMKDTKNHRIFLIVIGLYILLNSVPVYKLIYDMFPYLMTNINQVNLAGKILIGIIISVAVIISKSSLLSRI